MSENGGRALDHRARARAWDGLHQAAFTVLCQQVPPPADLWDIGCGQGAFSERVSQAGYNVKAVDGDIRQFKIPGVSCYGLNFDEAVEVENFVRTHGGRAHVTVALEIIEHVRNPWAFIKFCADMTAPDGAILLSTPNIGSIYSRLLFLRTGEFLMFRDYRKQFGHINPLTSAELEAIFDHYALEVALKALSGEMPSAGNTRHRLGVLASRMLAPFVKGDKDGIILLYLVRKQAGL